MRKAVVLGATGSMGVALVRELAGRGVETVAFARSRDRLEGLFRQMPNVEIRTGDALQPADLVQAVQGAEVIFHAINLPYAEWAQSLLPVAENVLEAAAQAGARVVLIDNIYAYGRSGGRLVTEDSPKRPHTKKGRIRVELGQLILAANERGIPALIAHFPDFYGPDAGSTLLQMTLQSVVRNKTAMFVGDPRISREFIFTPDGAKAAVELSIRDDAYGQVWNIPGSGVISGNEIMGIVRELTGYKGKVRIAGTGLIRLGGLFDKQLREYVEMMYLKSEPVVLSGDKYEKFIGPLPVTPYREGLEQLLKSLR